ncbi:unnamed protein product [marine sediment metagenome]|uniref:Uncharacterized protein n=1 Tax=marine sediment metagenome TaxID=412755 RepID=X1H889_9ZZZZ
MLKILDPVRLCNDRVTSPDLLRTKEISEQCFKMVGATLNSDAAPGIDGISSIPIVVFRYAEGD